MKKLVSVLLVLVMAFSTLPSFAESVAEDVLLKVKAKLEVPEELTEFNYSENKYEDVLRYDFTWHTEDYTKELYVSSDSLGRIVSYNYYEQADYNADRTLIDYTLSDAQPLAEETVKEMFPEYFADNSPKLVLNAEKTTTSYSGRYKSFSFTFERMHEAVGVESNRVIVRIRATKDKMYVQSVSAALDEDASFVSIADAKFDMASRQEKYEEKFPIRLYYATDYSEDEPSVALFYSIDKGYIAYATGEIITELRFDRYASVTEDSMAEMDAGSGLMSKNEATLSPKEQGEIDKMASLIKPDEIEKKLRELTLLKITDDMKFSESYTYKSDEKYFVNFTLEGEKRYMNVSYNGETGEIISIYSRMTKYDEEDNRTTDIEVSIPQDDIKAFAANLAGEKLNETEIEVNTENERSTMNAMRIVNGIPFVENNIAVTYDARNNMVTRYSISWTEDVSNFPKPEEVIGIDKAREIVFSAGMKDTFVKQEEGYLLAATLTRGVTINALTGEELYVQKKEKEAYTDIENHWAKDIINILWEHDVYLAGNKFMPDEAINQADMIRLFSACRDGGIVPIGWTKERIATYGFDNGYVEVNEPDKLITRKEAFKSMATILGYGDVVDFDIYKSSYVDSDADGSAEILKAMGVLTGDIARPEDYLTHAEAAVMVYRYLSK